MSPLVERLFAWLGRACAVLVASVPLAAGGVLIWLVLRALAGAPGAVPAGPLPSLIAASVGTAILAALVGGAIGVGCAVTAEELAPSPMRTAIATAIGFLGAMPAVAFGWFAASIVAPAIANAPGALAPYAGAAAILAAMAAPTACALTTRALRRMPDAIRQAAAALGASRLQTTVMVLIPALRRQIAAAGLAAFARAVVEATTVQTLFAALANANGSVSATATSWILASATVAPSVSVVERLAPAALFAMLIAFGCALLVSREFRGLQWA